MKNKKFRNLLIVIILTALTGFFALPSSSTGEEKFASNLEKRISLIDFKDMDISVVMKFLSQKSGMNFIASQGVTARISLYLTDVQVQEALDIIAKMYRLAYHQEGNVVMVMTQPEFKDEYGHSFGKAMETLVIPVTHISPVAASALLEQIKSDEGKVIPDLYSKKLIITDEKDKLNEMNRIVAMVDQKLNTEAFVLTYAEATSIAPKVEKLLTPTIGSLEFDDISNTLIVTDTGDVVNMVREYIDTFDKRQLEVSMESKIVQVTLSDEHKLGIKWQALVPEYHSLNLEQDMTVLSASEKFGRLGIGTIADDNYTAMLEALQTIGDTKILSNPHITALNKQEAKILVGSTEPYVTSTTTTPSAGPTTVSETVNFIEVGVKLFATPTIHEDGFITMKIKPEVSSVTRNVVTSNNNTIPVVETSEAETTVMVADGATIIIGGLIRDERVNTTKRVPILGRIPLVGIPFRSEDFFDRTTEIVIFLTPRIIRDGRQDLAGYSDLLDVDE